MELKNETNEKQSFAYEDETRPNPNAALFGGMGNDEPYRVTSSYSMDSASTPKKSGPSNVVILAIALIVVLMAGGLFYGEYKKANRYNGTYELVASEVEGVEYSIEYLEELSGMTFYSSIEIKGKSGYLVMDVMSVKREGKVKISVDGNTIILSGSGDEVKGTYDTSDNTITIYSEGVYLIYEKVD